MAEQVALSGQEGKTLGSVICFDTAIKDIKIIDMAKNAGVTAILQSGGSDKDEEIISYCNENSMIMYFTKNVYNKM